MQGERGGQGLQQLVFGPLVVMVFTSFTTRDSFSGAKSQNKTPTRHFLKIGLEFY